MSFLDSLAGFGRATVDALGAFAGSDFGRAVIPIAASSLSQRGFFQGPRTGPTGSRRAGMTDTQVVASQASQFQSAGPGGFAGPIGFNPLPALVKIAKNPAVQGAVGGALGAIFGDDIVGENGGNGDVAVLPGGAMVGGGNGGGSGLFRRGDTVRAVRQFTVINPVTGNPVVYRNMGRPLLYSGDIACAKRVQKIARRAGRGRR